MNVKKAAAVALLLVWLVLSRSLPTISQSGIVVTGADSVLSTSFSYSADLTVGPRIIVEYADSTHRSALVYPRELISDTIPPIITEVSASEITTKTATITWTTDEFSDSQVQYSLCNGSGTETVQDPLYFKNHTITLNNLAFGTNYCYIVHSTDRSGNRASSEENSFTTDFVLYLPVVLRNR